MPNTTTTTVSPATFAAITRNKALIGRAVDTKQWHLLSTVTLPTATLRFYTPSGALKRLGPTALAFDSEQAFTAFLSKYLAHAQTLHNFGLPELEQVDAETVRARFAMEDQVVLGGTWGLVEYRGGGYYDELWTLVEGEWLLKELVCRRTYERASWAMLVLDWLQQWFGPSG